MSESGTRLSTVDPSGARIWVYPADVKGRYRSRRSAVSVVLLLAFLLLPWLRIGGQQAMLLDLAGGRIAVFGIRFWFHDAPMLLFVGGGAAVTLAFVTAVWGRAWCGWACPQTVFVDQVFRRIERWIEGDAVRRRFLDAAPWSFDKLRKKAAKWALFTAVALVLSHSFLAYFIGTDGVARVTSSSPARSPGLFAAMLAMTGLVLLDFGWLREQFCTLLCPYGRFQSVLMDDRSLTVAYDRSRHEDCIDCRRCVNVCPTGIDIRDGLQLECVACTACIDACDAVMDKIRKPRGLVRYESGFKSWKHLGRAAGYLAVLVALATGLAVALARREAIGVTIVRKTGSPYEEVVRSSMEKEIVNRFRFDLVNQSFEAASVALESEEPSVQLVSSWLPLRLLPGESRGIDVFVRFPASLLSEGRGVGKIRVRAGAETLQQEVPLVGPYH